MRQPEDATLRPQLEAMRRAMRAKIERDLANEAATASALREEVRAALPDVIASLRERGLCGGAWLFGSYAWGAPTQASDVDLLVETEADPFELAAEIGRAIRRMVHLVRAHDAPATLLERARGEGTPL